MPGEAAAKLEAVEPEHTPAGAGDVTALPRKDITVKLEEKVQAHGEMIDKITFRKPTGNDTMQLDGGWPVDIDWPSGKVLPNPKTMGAIMSVLGQVPPSTIKALSAKDFTNCAFALSGFFTPDLQSIVS